jgi:excisionase family DNA binding protein
VTDLPAMLAPGDLARMLHGDAKTITRWSREGKLAAVFTPGGHRRFPLAAVLELLRTIGFDEQAALAAVRNLR